MTERQFKEKTKVAALRAIKLVESLSQGRSGDLIDGNCCVRRPAAANYRAVCRAKSPADMIAKLAIVEEEADATVFWLEMAVDSLLIKPSRVTDLLDEFNQSTAMVVTSQKTLRKNRQK